MNIELSPTTGKLGIYMEGAIRPAGIIEKLANAGFGAPLRSSADDVLARLKSRITPAA